MIDKRPFPRLPRRRIWSRRRGTLWPVPDNLTKAWRRGLHLQPSAPSVDQPAGCRLLGGSTFRVRSGHLLSSLPPPPSLGSPLSAFAPTPNTATFRSRPSVAPCFSPDGSKFRTSQRGSHQGHGLWARRGRVSGRRPSSRLARSPLALSVRPLCWARPGRVHLLAVHCLSHSRPGRQLLGPGSVCTRVCVHMCVRVCCSQTQAEGLSVTG